MTPDSNSPCSSERVGPSGTGPWGAAVRQSLRPGGVLDAAVFTLNAHRATRVCRNLATAAAQQVHACARAPGRGCGRRGPVGGPAAGASGAHGLRADAWLLRGRPPTRLRMLSGGCVSTDGLQWGRWPPPAASWPAWVGRNGGLSVRPRSVRDASAGPIDKDGFSEGGRGARSQAFFPSSSFSSFRFHSYFVPTSKGCLQSTYTFLQGV